MAWDKNRPYLPVDNNGNPTNFASVNPSKADIDQIYATCRYTVTNEWNQTTTFIPFKEVRLKLSPAWLFGSRTTAGIGFKDEHGHTGYYMFENTFKELCNTYESYQVPIDGYWTAEKRGQTYGIKLVRMANE